MIAVVLPVVNLMYTVVRQNERSSRSRITVCQMSKSKSNIDQAKHLKTEIGVYYPTASA